MPRARLEALHTLLAGLIARPEPGVLVVACTDLEVFYIVHTLTRLDEQSPADRFFICAESCTTLADYVAHVFRAAGRTPPDPLDDPAARFLELCTALLDDLPHGDHHLVVALLPTEMDDHPGFSSLARLLLQRPLDRRLRLVLRDDRHAPHHFDLAAASPSDQHFAHIFSLPPELVVASVRTTAHDPRARPDDRAQALLQLACQDLGHGRHADALARCDVAHSLSTTPALQLLALAFKADVLRRNGDTEAALALANSTLHRAVALQLHPVVLHLALALGDLTRELGRPADAAACFELAEKAAHLNPEMQARARALRAELPPC